MVFKNKRKFPRYCPKDAECIKLSITYMGEEIPCWLHDLSLGGFATVVNGKSFSLIDNSIVAVHIVTEELEVATRAKVVYSQRCDNKFRAQKYGLEFEFQRMKLIGNIISNYCQ